LVTGIRLLRLRAVGAELPGLAAAHLEVAVAVYRAAVAEAEELPHLLAAATAVGPLVAVVARLAAVRLEVVVAELRLR
jgi:hypothetical protein